MLWDTGVRVSELCDLDISQIDTNNRRAVIATKNTNSFYLTSRGKFKWILIYKQGGGLYFHAF